jgi:predicted acyltransferase
MLLVDGQGGTETFAMFKHSEWNGLTFTDCIAPCFMWIVGVGLSISLSKRLARGDSPVAIFGHALRRAVILFAIGVAMNLWLPALTAIVRWNADELNSWLLLGTLQRIAIGYLIATIVILITADLARQIVAAMALLAAYTGVFYLAPAPGFFPGDFGMAGNAVTYIDKQILGSHTNLSHPVLNSLPAGAMVFLGNLAGRVLTGGFRPAIKLVALTGAGALLVVGGLGLSGSIPVNYRLWTPSFFMAAGGIACLSFAMIEFLLESEKIRRGAHFLRVLGMNPILIWILAVDLKSLLGAKGFLDADGKWRSIWLILFEKVSFFHISPEMNSMIFALVFCFVLFLIAYILFSRNIVIRI